MTVCQMCKHPLSVHADECETPKCGCHASWADIVHKREKGPYSDLSDEYRRAVLRRNRNEPERARMAHCIGAAIRGYPLADTNGVDLPLCLSCGLSGLTSDALIRPEYEFLMVRLCPLCGDAFPAEVLRS